MKRKGRLSKDYLRGYAQGEFDAKMHAWIKEHPPEDAPPEGEEVEAVWNILFNLIQGVKHIRGEGFSEALGEAAREIVELLQKEKKGGSDG